MSALIITLGKNTYSLEEGETKTFKCKGYPMSSNFYVECISTAYFTYGNISYVGKPGAKIGLACSGKIMGENLVVYASDPFSFEDSPLPIRVSSEEVMKNKLLRATDKDVGSIYKYVGNTTENFSEGALYIITEEEI